MGSVASFFVSRNDTETDKRLDKIGTDEAKALRGTAAIANARLAYQEYEKVFGSQRWKDLADAGAKLAAAVGVDGCPAVRGHPLRVDLVAPGVVNTMPEATLDAVYDHGVFRGETIRPMYAEAKQVLDDLAERHRLRRRRPGARRRGRRQVRGLVERAARGGPGRAGAASAGEDAADAK